MRTALLACWLAAAAFAQQDADVASISGSVINRITGIGVKGAHVDITFSGPFSGPLQSGPQRPRQYTAATDEGGHFELQSAQPGQYFIRASHPSYPQFGPPGFENVTVTSGEKKTGVVIRLTPGATISGKVVGEDGDPLPNCMISALTKRGDGTGAQRSGAQTDIAGEYKMENLPHGKYVVRASCWGNPPSPMPLTPDDLVQDQPKLVYVPAFYPGSDTLATATELSLNAGAEAREIDLTLRAARGYSIKGQVTNIPAEGNNNVFVSLMRREDRNNSFGGSGVDRQGKFSIPNTLPGAYVLMVVSNGPTQARSEYNVEVKDSNVEGVLITLAAPLQLSGTITVDGDSDAKFAGGSIQLVSGTADQWQWLQPATIAQDGTFTLKGVSPGKWYVSVHAAVAGGKAAAIKSMRYGDLDLAPQDPITMAADTPPAALNVVMTTKMVSLSGTVIGADKPCIVMVVSDTNAPSGTMQSGVQSGQGGAFTIPLPPGRYRVYAFATPNWMQLTDDLKKRVDSYAESVKVEENGDAHVEVRPIPADLLSDDSQ